MTFHNFPHIQLQWCELHCTMLVMLHWTALILIKLHFPALHCTALNCTAALHCTALQHCTALACTALHCTALCCLTVTTCAQGYQSCSLMTAIHDQMIINSCVMTYGSLLTAPHDHRVINSWWHMEGLVMMVISTKNWEFLPYSISPMWIIQPHYFLLIYFILT